MEVTIVKPGEATNGYHVWSYWKRMKDAGKVVSVYKRANEPTNAGEVRAILSHFDFSSNEVDDMIYEFNKHTLHENGMEIREVLPDHEDEYILSFPGGIMALLNVADQYHGDGDFSRYAMIEEFIVPENVDMKDVKEMTEWLDKRFKCQ